jgi:hypothetical protein
MKHLLIYLGAFFVIIILAIMNIRFFSGPEDAWLCQDGAWVQHGHPYAPMPASFCEVPKQNNQVVNAPSEKKATSADEVLSEIKLIAPVANAIVSSPLTIEGEALGNWFFEGSFPVKLIGEDGAVLAQAVATAQGDWMTTSFVPFKAFFNFDPGSSAIGMIILQRDNPSGLPENDKQFGVPVRFSAQEKMTIKTFFGNTDFNPNAIDCSLVYPTERLINKTKLTARAALEELLAGVNEAEKIQGYYTSLNPGVKLNGVTIANGLAKADFDEQMDFQMGGSCRVATIRAQITETLKQFPSVKEVIISVNGNSEEALQP